MADVLNDFVRGLIEKSEPKVMEKAAKAFEENLASRPYVGGFKMSQDDAICFEQLQLHNSVFIPSQDRYPHMCRWMRHMSNYTPYFCRRLPKGLMSEIPSIEEPKKPDLNDDFDLYGEDTAEEKAAMGNLKKVATKEQKKKVINKSSLVIDVKPYSIRTDLDNLANLIKGIKISGLTWGETVKKVPIAFGLFKLQMICTIIDDEVNTEEIIDSIEGVGMTKEQRERFNEVERNSDEDDAEEDDDGINKYGCLVQSADIVSFNKL